MSLEFRVEFGLYFVNHWRICGRVGRDEKSILEMEAQVGYGVDCRDKGGCQESSCWLLMTQCSLSDADRGLSASRALCHLSLQ